MKRAVEPRTCWKNGKRRFSSEAAARGARARSRTIAARIRIYRCQHCQGYHFTSETERER